MRQPVTRPDWRIIALFSGLLIVTSSGIWSVPIYANQDGMPHLYNAFLIREIVGGNETVAQFAALNPSLIPNLTGHWILALLLTVFSPALATKVFVTLLLGGTALSVFFLRRQFAGRNDYPTALLLSFVIAFNWMWFLGFYNFILGVIGFAFTVGLWWRWHENLNFARSLIITVLFFLVFFSHLISFVILTGTLLVLTLTNFRAKYFKRSFFWTLFSVVLTLPLLFNFLILSNSNASLSPNWTSLENPFSVTSWLVHLRSGDPFQLISRKAIPFSEASSLFFGIFSSSVWLIAALFCLLAATFIWWRQTDAPGKRNSLVWFAISTALVFLWFIAPNDFGKSHGGYLRERLLLFGMVCFMPVFNTGKSKLLKRLAQAGLIFIFIFQTLVVWDYARYSNQAANEVLEAGNFIGDTESFGSIIMCRDDCKFKPITRSSLTPFITIDKNTRVLDNYELGYYLFPVIARNADDRQFIFEFRESNTYDFCDPPPVNEKKLNQLANVLEKHHDKIDVLLVWGRNEKIEALVNKWFESQPFYQNSYVRLFRRRGKIS